MVRCPAPLALATKAFPMASVGVGAPHGELGGQQDLGASESPHLALRGVWVTRCAPTPRTVGYGRGRADAAPRCIPGSRCLRRAAAARPPTHWPPRSPTTSPSMPVTISYHAGSGKGPIGVAGSEFSAAAVTTVPTSADRRPADDSGAAATLGPAVRPRRRFLVTVMVQIISRIHQPRRTP